MSVLSLSICGNSGASPAPGGACSAYLVDTGSTRVLLDCGPGSLSEIGKRTSLWDIDAIFISHMHTDHWMDLLALNVALFTTDGGPAAQGRRVPVYLPPGGRTTLSNTFAGLAGGVEGSFSTRWEESLDAVEYDPSQPVATGDATVSFVGPMKHATLAYGMRVEACGMVLGYTGDTANCPEAIEVGKGADVFLVECSGLEPGPWAETHIAATELGPIATETGCRLLLVTHLHQTDDPYRTAVHERVRAGFSGPMEVVQLGNRYAFFR